MKTIVMPVSKNTFERVVRGEQKEIYRTYGSFWLSKLFNPRTFLPVKYITITCGFGCERKELGILLKGIESKEKGRSEWESPKGKVYALYIDKIEQKDF